MKSLVVFLSCSIIVLCAACSDDTSSSPDMDADTGEIVDSTFPEPDSGPMNDSSIDPEDSAVDEREPDGSTSMNDAATDERDAAIGQPDAMLDASDTDRELDAAVPDAMADATSGADAETDTGTDAGDPQPEVIDVCGTQVAVDDYVTPGSEWIIDVAMRAANLETNPTGAVFLDSYALSVTSVFDWIERPFMCEETTGGCIDFRALEGQTFDDSDTGRAVLVGIPFTTSNRYGGSSGLAALTFLDLRDMTIKINADHTPDVVLSAAPVMPNDRIATQLEMMDAIAGETDMWLIETGWSSSGGAGFQLDDMVGKQAIERGIALGKPIFLVRKGSPLNTYSSAYTTPRDVGPSAVAYPAARFVVLTAAFEQGLLAGESSRPQGPAQDLGWGPGVGAWPEGPYDDSDEDVQQLYPLDRGVNSLITSLLDSDVAPSSNVFAALDRVWAELITRPTEAAHVLGKLLLYLGEDNVLWATDSVFYGGPSPQIEAFRTFQIPEALRNAHGYPELTPQIKAKILGLNAARLLCLPPPTP